MHSPQAQQVVRPNPARQCVPYGQFPGIRLYERICSAVGQARPRGGKRHIEPRGLGWCNPKELQFDHPHYGQSPQSGLTAG
jgi:hypothetical protein